jgi:hypothetical protein
MALEEPTGWIKPKKASEDARQFMQALVDECAGEKQKRKETEAALDAAMDCIEEGLRALNAAILLCVAEVHGHDRTADRLDRQVQAWRQTARAMVSVRSGGPNG